MIVVGLVGIKGSGKTSAAKVFERYGFERKSFAKPLKDLACQMFNLTPEQVQDEKLKEVPLPEWNNLTPRKILQHLGTEGFRHLDPDFWVKYLVNSLEKGKKYVIDDVRFLNEVEAIEDIGGLMGLTYMDRFNLDNLPNEPEHPSETLALDWTKKAINGFEIPCRTIERIKLTKGRPEFDEPVIKGRFPVSFFK